MSGERAMRAEMKRNASHEINSAKHRLMDVMSKLESAGLLTLAWELGNRIAALESWQNRKLK